MPIDKAGKAEKDEPPVLAWGNRELTISDPGKSIRVAHDMHKILCKEPSEAERSFFKAQSLFYELLDIIASSRSDESISGARMEDVVAYVRTHYADFHPRNRLASTAGVHPDHFFRLFRKKTGKGYVDFVTEFQPQI
ncbi:helix-turn-helix transcriptional regulator [Cohnella sp. LGH]|uniref:helix-turn-helix transcriptional regulator n=1 Tax=Cohnella sp. LGH TaxID=1619153 RepID=UPI001ADA1E25|nr:helix-turn-helix transcriptional regulator [Cohnella sp. LGH]QTH43924.1 helix-turn-helix transcriptional regulator [Cohnella sp. LGH]